MARTVARTRLRIASAPVARFGDVNVRGRRRILIGVKRTILPIAVAVALLAAAGTDAQQFSARERRVLDSQEHVRHPRTQRRDGRTYVGGTAFRVIPRSRDEVWRAVEDSRSMCRMLPQCVRQRIVRRNDDRLVMRFTHEYGPITASYHVRVELNRADHDVSFRLDPSRPNDVRAAWGFLEVAPYRDEPDRTLVTWGVMADPGSQVMTSVLGGSMQASLLRVPDEMYDYLVGPARNRYRR